MDRPLTTAAAEGIIGGYERDEERVRLHFDECITNMTCAHAHTFLASALTEWMRAEGTWFR